MVTLDEIALKYRTDKASSHHNHTKVYEKYLDVLRDQELTLLEIGIGGYHHIDRGGESLRMWREYFSKAIIVAADLYAKNPIEGCIIKQISQDNQLELMLLTEEYRPDIVIDDASHINPLTIETFRILWPQLKPGGLYFVEDIESSWCPIDAWGKGCNDHKNYDAETTINHFRKLCDEVNAQYIPHFESKVPGIESIHFYKNMIVIKKKL